MNSRYLLFRNKLLPHLGTELIQMFPIEIWDLILRYYYIAESMTCPLTGEVFVNPVIIGHHQVAPIVYERAAIMLFYKSEALQELGITSENFSRLLKPVPMVKSLVRFMNDSNSEKLLESLIENNEFAATNLSEELKYEIDSKRSSVPMSSRKIMEFINLYDAPLSVKPNEQEVRFNNVPIPDLAPLQ